MSQGVEITEGELFDLMDLLKREKIRVKELDTFECWNGQEGIEIILDERENIKNIPKIGSTIKIERPFIITKRPDLRLSLIDPSEVKQDCPRKELFSNLKSLIPYLFVIFCLILWHGFHLTNYLFPLTP